MTRYTQEGDTFIASAKEDVTDDVRTIFDTFRLEEMLEEQEEQV